MAVPRTSACPPRPIVRYAGQPPMLVGDKAQDEQADVLGERCEHQIQGVEPPAHRNPDTDHKGDQRESNDIQEHCSRRRIAIPRLKIDLTDAVKLSATFFDGAGGVWIVICAASK